MVYLAVIVISRSFLVAISFSLQILILSSDFGKSIVFYGNFFFTINFIID